MAASSPIISAIRVIIAAGLSLIAFVMLFGMFTSETQNNYANWALSGGLLVMAVAFSFIIFDGEDELETDLQK